MVGRTENSIKNYFYSSIRRIQSSEMYRYLSDLFVSKRISYLDLDSKMTEIKKAFFSHNLLSRSIFLFMINKEN